MTQPGLTAGTSATLLALVAACQAGAPADKPAGTPADAPAGARAPVQPRPWTDDPRFSRTRLLSHVEFLASDELEGRLPGARGGQIATEYLASQVKSYGLEPGAEDGTYIQRVPLVGIETGKESVITLTAGNHSIELPYLVGFVGADETLSASTAFEAPVVFVGYGIVAPEEGWNDYEGVDVKGKVVLILANEPGRDVKPSEDAGPAKPLFKGPELTYYGRWTYKFEEAARQGAIGALLLHTDESAGYGWAVVKSSWGRERPYPKVEGERALSMAAWIQQAAAHYALKQSGLDFSALRQSAEARGFRAVKTSVAASVKATTAIRPIETSNVLARIPGSDPALRDELVVYTAHYDHLGVGAAENGDAIYNGAVDNASGCAIVLEIARALSNLPEKPRRSILFAFVTAEEGGLRGSEFLARHPPVPAAKIAADINLDGVQLDGDPAEITALGHDRSTLGASVARAAANLGVSICADRDPRQGFFFRSDHFSFAKVGVPSVNVNTGNAYVGKPANFGPDRDADYRKNRYHRPSDQFDPSWDGVAGVKLAAFALSLGLDIANDAALPAFLPGDEFSRAQSTRKPQ